MEMHFVGNAEQSLPFRGREMITAIIILTLLILPFRFAARNRRTKRLNATPTSIVSVEIRYVPKQAEQPKITIDKVNRP